MCVGVWVCNMKTQRESYVVLSAAPHCKDAHDTIAETHKTNTHRQEEKLAKRTVPNGLAQNFMEGVNEPYSGGALHKNFAWFVSGMGITVDVETGQSKLSAGIVKGG